MLSKKYNLEQLFQVVILFISMSLSPAGFKDDRDLAKLDQKIYSYYYSSFDSVLNFADKAFEIATRIDSADLQIAYLDIMYLCAIHHKRMKEAKQLLDRENEFYEKSKYKLLDTIGYYSSSCLFNESLYHYTYGDYLRAIDGLLRIIDLDRIPATSDSGILHSSCNYLGQAYYNIGDLDRSMLFFEKGWHYAPSDESSLNYEALYYMYKGEYLFDVGKIDESFENFKRALGLLRKADRTTTLNLLKSNYLLIASYYFKTEKFDSSLKYARSSIRLSPPVDPELPVSQRLIGTLFYSQKLYDSSLYYHHLALQNLNKIYERNHISKYAPLLGIANIFRDNREFALANNTYKESLKNLQCYGKVSDITVENSYFPREIMKVLLEMARMYKSWYDQKNDLHFLDTCMALSKTAIALNDAARRELFDIETRESKAFFQSEIVDVAVESAFQAYASERDKKHLEIIFEFLEKVKGNILKDQANEVQARKFAGIPLELLNQESELKGRLSYYKTRLNSSQNESAMRKTRNEYDSTLKAYMNFTADMEEKFPAYYRLKYDPKDISLSEIQKSLPAGALLIHYSKGPKKLYMAGVTRKEMVLAETPVNYEFTSNLYVLIHQLADPRIMEISQDQKVYHDFVKSSSYIYGHIMAPILKQVNSPVHKLIIIPDGELCYLPFEVLIEEYTKEAPYNELHYLIKRYSISYDYSAALWMEKHKNWSNKSRMYIGYAPFNESASRSLIASGNEVDECAKIWNGRSYKGLYATESIFKQHSMDAGIFHLAAHATLNDKEPQKSCFAFSSSSDSINDGLLYTYELYNMKLSARMAILSGCETGIGMIKRGEGIISLARAFKYAGCDNIIMSLWKVNDKTACDIIIAFNKNLKKGMQKDNALQKAKLDYLRSNNPHPAFWSSFVLIGNNERLRRNRTLFYLIPAILAVFLFLFKRKNP